MRWIALLVLALLFQGAVVWAEDASQKPPKLVKPPSHLPTPTAEPANAGAYGPVVPYEKDGPTDADIGPVQKHFVMAYKPDDVALDQVNDNATMALKEKIALDGRISFPVIHDVQNDSSYKSAGNDALEFETKYLNWGAVTQAQLDARRGHYFTTTWRNEGPKADFVIRFEYRQVKSQEVIRKLEQKMPQVEGTTRSYFAVVNKAYLAYGPVCSWRFTIRKGDTIVAEAKSFLW